VGVVGADLSLVCTKWELVGSTMAAGIMMMQSVGAGAKMVGSTMVAGITMVGM